MASISSTAAARIEKGMMLLILIGAIFALTRWYVESYVEQRLSENDVTQYIKVLDQPAVITQLHEQGYKRADIADYLDLTKRIMAKNGVIIIDKDSLYAAPNSSMMGVASMEDVRAMAAALGIKSKPEQERLIPPTKKQLEEMFKPMFNQPDDPKSVVQK